jgi:hypothetical protein
MKLYINGALDCQMNYPGTINPSVMNVSIGADPGSDGSTVSYFHGAIDEPSLYNRALTADEVLSIYNAGSAGKCRVLAPPSITSQPTGATVYAGDTVTFSVAATGEPILAYQWNFNNSILPGATNTSLTLYHVPLQDAGNYSVSVSNEVGTVTSSNAALVVNPPPPCTTMPDGLISWWRGENSPIDSRGSNDLQASQTIIYMPGKVGQGFSGSSLVALDSPSLRLTDAMTVGAWVYPTAFVGGTLHVILSKIDSFLSTARQNAYFLGADVSGIPYFRVSPDGTINSNGIVTASAPLPTNEWSFVCASYDGANLRVYTNANLAAQVPYSSGVFAGSATLGAGSGWPGGLDEIALFGRALTDSEVLSLYTASVSGMCLVPPALAIQPQDQAVPFGETASFWASATGTPPFAYQWNYGGSPLAGATNQTLLVTSATNTAGLYSVTVSNNAGSVVSSSAVLNLLPSAACDGLPPGAISWWPSDGSGVDIVGTNRAVVYPGYYGAGKVGQAFDLTRADVRAPNSPSLNIGSNADFSIETWVKSYAAFANPATGLVYPIVPLVQKRAALGLDGTGYMLALNNGRLAFWLGAVRTPAVPTPLFTAADPDLRDGQFHHLAVTVSRGSSVGGTLYLDGEAVLSFDPTSQQGDLSNSGPLLIGVTDITTNSYFNGYIDELTLYGRALSRSELQRIFQSGSMGKCKSAPVISSSLIQSNHSALLSWRATGFTLYETPSLANPLTWSPVTNTVGIQPGGSAVTIPADGPTRFFRLRSAGN